MTTTLVYFGGSRYWFLCPGRGCGRRVGKLYGAGKYFLCRHCYNLTYDSCRESHRFDRIFGELAREAGLPVSAVVKTLFGGL
ncbi:MAG: hypothetical protein WCQ99_12005 [Pseudomonadota bacterium]